MTPHTVEMFEKPPRAKPRVMMHAVDAGHNGPLMARFECRYCDYDTEWIETTATEIHRGIPCPNCNNSANSIT